MQKTMSIWFFAGVMFLLYGILITGAGLWEIAHPPANPPALYNLHAPIWWGAMMLAAGLFYTLKFRPR
jgi:hypothetical protein